MPAMNQTLLLVGLFVLLLAMLPLGLKWMQSRLPGKGLAMSSASKVISAIAVGPHQRVVTVEVGPEGARTWLTLGVTAQTITCLHTVPVEASAEASKPSSPYAPVVS